jgi:hypothetical protein
MSKASKLAERQRRNKVKRLIDSADQGKITNPDILGATAPLTDEQKAFYDEIMPLVKAGLKDGKIYYLVPLMEITDIYQEKGRWLLSDKYVLETPNHKFGQKASHSLKALLDTDQVAMFCNHKGHVFMPNVEKVTIEKEVVKTVSTGIKMKDIDKAIEKALHPFKDSFQYEGFKKMFESFKDSLL